jgi:hypothetical protein
MQIFFSVFWWIYFFIFFTGYPLLYAAVFFTGKTKNLHHFITERIHPLLPLAYAFVSTIFWILMICTGRMNFIAERIASGTPSVLVILFSLSALLFWLPAFRKNIALSFIHSLPFFLLPPLNMLWKTLSHKVVANDYILNLLRIYSASVILYLLAIVFLLFVKWVSITFFFKHCKA